MNAIIMTSEISGNILKSNSSTQAIFKPGSGRRPTIKESEGINADGILPCLCLMDVGLDLKKQNLLSYTLAPITATIKP